MDEIKDECNKIIEDDSIEKKTALGMMKVQHSMETLMLKKVHDQEFEKVKLENEIQLIKITSKTSGSIEEIKTTIQELTAFMKKLEKNQDTLTKTLEEVCDMVENVKINFEKKILQLEDKHNIFKNALESLKTVNETSIEKQISQKKN